MFNLFPFLLNNLPNNLGSMLGNMNGGMNGGPFSGFFNIDITGVMGNLGNMGNMGNMGGLGNLGGLGGLGGLGNLGGLLNGMGGFNNRNMSQNMIGGRRQNVQRQIEQPHYDIEMRDIGDYYLIRGYLPGVNPQNIDIDIQSNKAILTVKRSQTYNNTNYSIDGDSEGNIKKDFYITEVDPTKMSAVFKNDILLLAIPKVKKIEEAKQEEPKIIDVDSYSVK